MIKAMDNYLTSGQMAEANCISKKALRVYREKGILEPHHINPETGRCYYDIRQSSKLDMIVRLQGIGMSLDEISLIDERKDIDALRDGALARVAQIDAELESLSIARQLAANLADSCETIEKRPLLDQIMLENLPERHILKFDIPNLEDKGLEKDSASEWEWVIRNTKKKLLENGYPLSLFHDIHALRSSPDASGDVIPKRDYSFVFVSEAHKAYFERSERIEQSQYLTLYLDRGYDEDGHCLSNDRIRRMMDYMDAKELRLSGYILEEIIFRFPYLLSSGSGILYRICIPVEPMG